ncbi:MAG: hypothetical protein AAF497_28425 [Planctomycetota bacterium]
MELLPLNDVRWKDLCHRDFSDGEPSDWVPDAPFVPDVLTKLVDRPESLDIWNDLWPWLCSEGTAWSAAFAVVPYAVEFARRVPPESRFDYLVFIGSVIQCSCPNSGPACELKPFLKASYLQALQLALPLIGETLSADHDQTETRYLLSAIAALKGHIRLANVLENIDCISAECACGESVYPDELQEVA